MSVLDKLIGLLAPHSCLGCGKEGSVLCYQCAQRLPAVPERCYRCHRLSAGFRTCSTCCRTSYLYTVRVATVYEDLPKAMIWKFKFEGAQAAARQLSAILAALPLPEDCVIVPVPTATSRVRRRGYDQAKLLGRELAKLTHLQYLDCLGRSGQAHQVGASRHQRLRQLEQSFRVKQPSTVQDKHILLIDDIVTTGATLEAAAKVLKQASARRIEAAVFAQP